MVLAPRTIRKQQLHRTDNVQEAREDVDLMADAVLADIAEDVGKTQFIGYDHLHLDAAPVLEIVCEGKKVEEVEEGATANLVLSTTPFYAESGGQIGDRGHMEVRVVLVCQATTSAYMLDNHECDGLQHMRPLRIMHTHSA